MRSIRNLCAVLTALIPSTAFAMGGPSPGAVTAQTVKLPSGPGSVRGLADDASVSSFTGQVQYAVPIELPAGPGGLTPSLSLGYDGGLGNGPLGVGWNLSQAGIQRSTRSGVPKYNATDEIELVGLGGGGQVVKLASGELRIEGAGNAYTGRTVNGGYELTDPDGRVYTFGTTAAARKASSSKVSFWYLEQVSDVAGNTIVYRYHNDATDKGEVYLEAIEWGPMVGAARAFRATLEYQTRTDAVVSYRVGFRVESAKRLARVRVWSFGVEQRIVSLSYETGFSLTRVKSVQVTSGDGSVALPPVSFTYAAAQTGTQTEVLGVNGWALNAQGTSLFDVDNDGAMDLLRLTGSGHGWRRNTGGQFAAVAAMPGAAGATLDQVRLVDLDGDSVAEMVVPEGSQWVVHKLIPASGSWVSLGSLSGAANLSLSGVAIADVNGDQRMDVLSPYGSQLQLRMGTATGLSAAATKPAIDPSPLRTSVQPGNAATSFYDLNGDGLADAIYLAASELYLYLGKGDGTFAPYKDLPYPWSGTYTASQIRLGDLNRDGLLDAVLVSGGNVAWYRGRANGTFETVPVSVPRPPGTDATVVVAVADANGNGSEDLVWSSDAGMWIVDIAGPTTAGMLVKVDNGLGQLQRFGYQASTSLMFAADSAGAAWAKRLPVSIPIAVTTRLTLASGEPERSSRLVVRDGIYDAVERRFIGFEESTVTRPDPADGASPAATIRVVTRHAPGLGMDRVLRGQVISERIEDGTGAVYLETTNEVAAVAVAGLPATDPRLRRAVVLSTEARHHEGQATPLVTRDEHTYDDEGRVIETRALGRLDVVGDESIERTRYTNGRSANGVRDRVCDTALYAPSGSSEELVSHGQTLFGDDQTVAPLCEAAAGWPRVTQQYLASESRWVRLSETTYSANGLPLQTTSAGVTRDVEYDAHGMHPVAEEVSPQAGTTLRWRLTWDDVLQVPVRVVDADGGVVVMTYDGLGRPRSVAREGAAPHVHYTYHAAGPRPYVETFTYDGPIDTVPALPVTWTPESQWRHTVAVLDSAAEPLFEATRLESARWLIAGRRVRDASGRTVAIADSHEAQGALAELVAGALPAEAPLHTVAYDALDRPILQTLPNGTPSTHVYRAFETTVTSDGMAPVTTYLDGRGRILRTQRTVNGVVEAVEATYDAAGRLTAMRLPIAGGAVEHRFVYDTLGRLTFATDPDIGDRELAYDDAGRLVANTNAAEQTTAYTYDGAGRLRSVIADDGSEFGFHYDEALDGAMFQHTAGRVAWIEEPTGIVQHGYDAFGHEIRVRRTVHGRTADRITSYGASGLALSIDDGDGFSVAMSYDAAGRPVQVGDLWQLESQDAAGRLLRERFGNDVVQIYERDVLGAPTRIRIERPDGLALYDVAVAHNPYGAITSVTDQDGVGLDHAASFGYDGGARLVSAVMGTGPSAYSFAYQYDGLQNMIQRDVAGPTALPILGGQYRYGELDGNGLARGPRQLTSIAPPGAAPATTFDYDGAGRVVRQGGMTLAYNGFDKLVSVQGVPTAGGPPGTVSYAYGHDGVRVSTIGVDGEETIRFNPSITESADGTREVDVFLGDRLIARVTRASDGSESLATAENGIGRGVGIGVAQAIQLGILVGGPLLVIASLVLMRRPRRRRAWMVATAAALPLALLLGGCHATSTTSATASQSVRTTIQTAYYHATISAGPSVITRDDGSVLDERRSEPFGAHIDSFQELPAGGTATGPIDYARDPHNVLNKQSDAATGWSDHGARWLAPETGRWLTPDPPVKAPDPTFMAEPWALHPYQYVTQNPILFWDPDGRDHRRILSGDELRDEVGRIREVLRQQGSDVSTDTKPTRIATEGWVAGISGSLRGNGADLSITGETVKETMAELLSAIGDTPIRRLFVNDHGNSKRQMFRIETLVGSWTDKDGFHIYIHPELEKLAGKFTDQGVLALGGCLIGKEMGDPTSNLWDIMKTVSTKLDVEVRVGMLNQRVTSYTIKGPAAACRGNVCVLGVGEEGIEEAWIKLGEQASLRIDRP